MHMLSVSPQEQKGLNSTAFVRAKGLLLDEEEKELDVRPILPQYIPGAGCCVQTHNISWVQKRPDNFSAGPSHTFCKIFATAVLNAIAKTKALQRQPVKPNANVSRQLPGIPTPLPMPPLDL